MNKPDLQLNLYDLISCSYWDAVVLHVGMQLFLGKSNQRVDYLPLRTLTQGQKLMLSLDADYGDNELCCVQIQETILEELFCPRKSTAELTQSVLNRCSVCTILVLYLYNMAWPSVAKSWGVHVHGRGSGFCTFYRIHLTKVSYR